MPDLQVECEKLWELFAQSASKQKVDIAADVREAAFKEFEDRVEDLLMEDVVDDGSRLMAQAAKCARMGGIFAVKIARETKSDTVTTAHFDTACDMVRRAIPPFRGGVLC